MSAPTINEQREALATILGSIPNTQVSAYGLSNPTPPTLQVVGGALPGDITFGASADEGNEFKIQLLAGLATDIGAQKLIGRYCDVSGNYSIKAKIAADPTLGGVVRYASVESVSEEQIYTSDRGAYVGREFLIEVIAAGG